MLKKLLALFKKKPLHFENRYVETITAHPIFNLVVSDLIKTYKNSGDPEFLDVTVMGDDKRIYSITVRKGSGPSTYQSMKILESGMRDILKDETNPKNKALECLVKSGMNK